MCPRNRFYGYSQPTRPRVGPEYQVEIPDQEHPPPTRPVPLPPGIVARLPLLPPPTSLPDPATAEPATADSPPQSAPKTRSIIAEDPVRARVACLMRSGQTGLGPGPVALMVRDSDSDGPELGTDTAPPRPRVPDRAGPGLLRRLAPSFTPALTHRIQLARGIPTRSAPNPALARPRAPHDWPAPPGFAWVPAPGNGRHRTQTQVYLAPADEAKTAAAVSAVCADLPHPSTLIPKPTPETIPGQGTEPHSPPFPGPKEPGTRAPPSGSPARTSSLADAAGQPVLLAESTPGHPLQRNLPTRPDFLCDSPVSTSLISQNDLVEQCPQPGRSERRS